MLARHPGTALGRGCSIFQFQLFGFGGSKPALFIWFAGAYPPEVYCSPSKVTFPSGKESSNNHFSGAMLNFGGVLIHLIHLPYRVSFYATLWPFGEGHSPNVFQETPEVCSSSVSSDTKLFDPNIPRSFASPPRICPTWALPNSNSSCVSTRRSLVHDTHRWGRWLGR